MKRHWTDSLAPHDGATFATCRTARRHASPFTSNNSATPAASPTSPPPAYSNHATTAPTSTSLRGSQHDNAFQSQVMSSTLRQTRNGTSANERDNSRIVNASTNLAAHRTDPL